MFKRIIRWIIGGNGRHANHTRDTKVQHEGATIGWSPSQDILSRPEAPELTYAGRATTARLMADVDEVNRAFNLIVAESLIDLRYHYEMFDARLSTVEEIFSLRAWEILDELCAIL